MTETTSSRFLTLQRNLCEVPWDQMQFAFCLPQLFQKEQVGLQVNPVCECELSGNSQLPQPSSVASQGFLCKVRKEQGPLTWIRAEPYRFPAYGI